MWKSIKISDKVKERLDKIKIHRNQSYNEVIEQLMDKECNEQM